MNIKFAIMRFCLLFGMLFVCNNLFSQNQLSYRQACEDIDYYFSQLDSVHPNMYWHSPKQVVDSFIMALKGKLKEPVDINQVKGKDWTYRGVFRTPRSNKHAYKGKLKLCYPFRWS